MSRSNKAYIPLKGTTRNIQMNCNRTSFTQAMLYKSGKAGHLSTPHIIPKFDLGAISQLKFGMTRNHPPPPDNILPKPHPIQPKSSIKHHPPKALLNLESTTTLHNVSLSCT
jgi:hypothetical protein